MTERPAYDKQARRAERGRIVRLSRLPPLYELAARGRPQAVLASVLQIVLALALTLAGAYLLTGELLPRYVALAALAVAYALQFLARYLNARAGRT